MRNVQRIFYERKTRRLVGNMMHKYSDIRLSTTTKAIARKRRRIEATDARVHKTNQGHDHDDQTEGTTSSRCRRTETGSTSRSSFAVLNIKQNKLEKGHKHQQSQQIKAHLGYLRMSDNRASSKHDSSIRDENGENHRQGIAPVAPDSESVVSTLDETGENQQNSSSISDPDPECDDSTPTSTPTQAEIQPECPEGESSSTVSPTTSTEPRLPRLRPTAPVHCVIPNCCDYFTSPHPHYPKERIGFTKTEDSSSSASEPTDPVPSDTSEVDNERGDSDSQSNDTSGAPRNSDEFEMWDYVCPQYARRYYANEWV
ncbi:hypothetical protein PsorP6_001552 [Peronosclerospora sorghi]|uniref:Uncharacterized protein n=1 Tax=Peronosclerospora sorghi TaxID=230839 RepID=A0ACC0WWE1_9STRA|nr:hypothetical protein PsorP6_001552 [Peronosclerospora sorghi]